MRRLIKRLKYVSFYFILSIVPLEGNAQNKSDFETIIVNKYVKCFSERYSQNSPVDAYISISYIQANGRQSMWKPYSTYRFSHSFPQGDTPDQKVSDKFRNEILKREIKECIIYKDSVAAVISTSDQDSLYLIRYLSKEDGRWLNAGENIIEGISKTRENVIDNLPSFAGFIPMIEVIKQTPTDTINFINYLKAKGQPPHQYIIKKLAKHKIVIYGERHRRKVSWDMLKQVIQEPDFAKTTGIVFFELPSYKQENLDRFYAQEELDTSILLDIFGCEQINGWHDKDEFDFMIALWKLNKKLPNKQKIRVVLADYQTQWDSIRTAEDFANFPKKNRNTNMADLIEHTINTTIDKRNSLFIVGYMHAYKTSRIPGLFSTPNGQEEAPTAGAQLAKRFSGEDVFCIFPHCLSESNRGEIGGRIRNGLFDCIFELNKNKPVAFDLAESPFGGEPFDAGLEIKFNSKIGNYEDNYDGYIFFQKLEKEEKGVPLYELFTDAYVEEVKRRLRIVGVKDDQIWSYGTPMKDLTKEIIRNSMEKYAEGKMWDIKE
jgi:hypothetical protein